MLCLFADVGVDPVVIESRADEMVGSVSKDEYKALVGHLSEGQGGAFTNALEKAKRKRASLLATPKKKGWLLDDILQ